MILLRQLFGRARSIERLNSALSGYGLAAEGFPDPIRLSIVRLAKEATGTPQRHEPKDAAATELNRAIEAAAGLFAYCYLGPADFADRCGTAAGKAMHARAKAALTAPKGLDAQVILLCLLSGYAHDDIDAEFGAETEDPPRPSSPAS